MALIRVLIRISQPTSGDGADCVRSGLAVHVSKHKGLILRCCTGLGVCKWGYSCLVTWIKFHTNILIVLDSCLMTVVIVFVC